MAIDDEPDVLGHEVDDVTAQVQTATTTVDDHATGPVDGGGFQEGVLPGELADAGEHHGGRSERGGIVGVGSGPVRGAGLHARVEQDDERAGGRHHRSHGAARQVDASERILVRTGRVGVDLAVLERSCHVVLPRISLRESTVEGPRTARFGPWLTWHR